MHNWYLSFIAYIRLDELQLYVQDLPLAPFVPLAPFIPLVSLVPLVPLVPLVYLLGTLLCVRIRPPLFPGACKLTLPVPQ
jgi:hypothetical protein